jgi:cytochrome b6-f complex iron-sulfur subunit
LSWGLLAASAALIAKLFSVGLRFAQPRAVAGEFGGQFDLGRVTDLPDSAAPPSNHPAGRFFLVRTSEGVCALYKVCTHLNCLLTWDDQANAFVCPCHGSQFDRSGRLITGPASRSLDQFPVKLVTPAGEVVAETDPRRGGPVAVPGSALPGESVKEAGGATTTDGADDAGSAGGAEEVPAGSELRVMVDTGRLIMGRPGSARVERGS